MRGLLTTGGQIPIEKHYHSFKVSKLVKSLLSLPLKPYAAEPFPGNCLQLPNLQYAFNELKTDYPHTHTDYR